MAEVKWIKIVPDVFDDDKIKLIENMPDGDSIIVVWFKLLCLAGKQNRDGFLMLNDKIAYTEEMLSTIFRRPISTVRFALKTFEQFDMINIIDGAVCITNWEKHQNVDRLAEIREYNRLAQQKSRSKKKLLADVNDNVNDKSMTSQRCHEIEEDIEEDLEKEYHSFNLSCESEKEILIGDEYTRKLLGGIGKNKVFLSDLQIGDLLDKMSVDEFNHYVSIVAENELKGHKYKKKTHYQAILDMARKDRKI